MDQSTRQNATMVEETSAAARNLNTEVTSLPGQTAMFKTENAAHRVAVSKTVVALSTLVKKHQEPAIERSLGAYREL
jgi:methyl-accepting chemotaxis protein